MTSHSSSWNRRRFLGSTLAGGAALALGPRLASAAALGANDRIRIGVVGTGGRARHLMRLLKELPGCEMVAVSDAYEPRMLEAAEIAGPAAAKHPDYRRLLDDKEIHAVVVGSPDHWHLKMTADALAAGKDVYLEKPVSRTLEDGDALLKLAEGTKQVVQTGTQQRSWEHFALGKQIVDSGKLGQVTFVHTFWHQRMGLGAWPAVDQAKLDWKAWLGPAPEQPWNPERFFRVAPLPGLRRRRPDRPPHPLDRRRALVPRGHDTADGGRHLGEVPGQDDGLAGHRHRHPRVPEGLHGHPHRDLRELDRRRRPRVPGGPGDAQGRPGAARRLQRGLAQGPALAPHARSRRSSSARRPTGRAPTSRTGSTASGPARRPPPRCRWASRPRGPPTSPTSRSSPGPGSGGTRPRGRSRGPDRCACDASPPSSSSPGLAAVPACRKADAPKGGAAKTLRIAFVPKGTTHEFWRTIHAGALKAQRDLAAKGVAVELIWKGPLREDDREQQVQVVEWFASQGVDGIVLAPLDEKALVRPVEEAKRLGVPTVIIDSALGSDQIVSFVATDNVKGGEMAADALGRLLGGKGARAPAALPGGLGQHHRARGGLPRAAEGGLAAASSWSWPTSTPGPRSTPRSARPRTC